MLRDALQIPAVTSGFSNLTSLTTSRLDATEKKRLHSERQKKAAGMEKHVPKRFITVSAMYPKASVLSRFDKALLPIQGFLVMWL